MILAVFSDIHGNVFSLEEALIKIESFKPDKYLFLGDMAGYYYFQNESIELLNSIKKDLFLLKGNHDQYFLDSLKDKNFTKYLDNKYGKSYSLLQKNITQESLKFFNRLQNYEKNSLFEAYHGSPNNYLEDYIYPDSKNKKFENIQAKTIFLGHTHYPMKKMIDGKLFINPGSIGQPRDFNKGSFSIVDLISLKIENIRYEYDKNMLLKVIKKVNDREYISNILKRVSNEEKN
jgi:putative phosphoesterase